MSSTYVYTSAGFPHRVASLLARLALDFEFVRGAGLGALGAPLPRGVWAESSARLARHCRGACGRGLGALGAPSSQGVGREGMKKRPFWGRLVLGVGEEVLGVLEEEAVFFFFG